MADNQNNAVELFSAAQNESKLEFRVDVQTLIDAAKIPLEMAYEAKIKRDAVALKAKEKAASDACEAYRRSLERRDDALITDRVAEFRDAIANIRETTLDVAGDVDVREVAVEIADFRVNDGADTRTFSIKATVPFSSTLVAGSEDDGYGVRGVGVSLQATIVTPLTAEQKDLKKASEDLDGEREALKTSWTALVKEKDEAVRSAERLARTKYASVALSEVNGGADLVNKVYDQTFYANLAGSLANLGFADVLASKLLPGSGDSLQALDAPKASKKSS